MSNSRTKNVVRIVIILACMFFGACAGVSWSALHITGKPQVFRSLAKIVAGGPIVASGDLQWREQLQDFYGTIIETLESAEMIRKARERVHALHPDLKDSDVDIRVAQTKGSAIINILATGSEPKYTQIFLNALLDEFMAFRQIIREQAQGKVLSTFLQEVVNKQKKMEDASAELAAVGSDAKNILARTELERLTGRLVALSNERDDLRMTVKSTPPDAAEKTTRLSLLEEEIQRISHEIVEPEAAAARLNALTQRHATAKLAYEEMFKQAENFQKMFNSKSDYVAIQERATTASEHTEDWKMPIILGGAGGAILGLVTGLLVSLLISLLGRSNAPQA
jgi:capsular polysaccharide biosynthesis protein